MWVGGARSVVALAGISSHGRCQGWQQWLVACPRGLCQDSLHLTKIADPAPCLGQDAPRHVIGLHPDSMSSPAAVTQECLEQVPSRHCTRLSFVRVHVTTFLP